MPEPLRMSGEDVAKAQLQANEVNATLKAKKGKLPAELDKDSFLKLLVAELRHQDPTQPMNDREFISQMAQFSSLEQMSNMNQAIERLVLRSQSGEAFSLIGKEVEAVDFVSQQLVRGVASGVVYRQDGVKIIVGSTEVSLNDIHAVYMPKNNLTNENKKTQSNEITEKTNNTVNEQTKGMQQYQMNNTFVRGSSSTIQPLRN
ncbi:MAG TPA: flagellar hook capping FlgD N-terminal domain-containing protein [Spirochaetota bacterium]|nr:flagellar hook capping FlgD N-terminal domain-containing protein [Spirochaetota bacterium]HQI38184.1 flagellar hook capping FlgD N-terminal domain-containing protein [Spirochaetota bacterium]HQK07151.1 flagellar hook capping FlgD N-terminal domain-containing protein [Spirochaetota bacterium]